MARTILFFTRNFRFSRVIGKYPCFAILNAHPLGALNFKFTLRLASVDIKQNVYFDSVLHLFLDLNQCCTWLIVVSALHTSTTHRKGEIGHPSLGNQAISPQSVDGENPSDVR